MGRAARANPCSYAGGKRLPEVVTARTKRQFHRDGSPEAMKFWAKMARFTPTERAFVRAQQLAAEQFTVNRQIIDTK